jgi:hypothetical protein
MLPFRWITRLPLEKAGILPAMLTFMLLLPGCSSHTGLQTSEIDSAEDSLVLGRISIRPDPECERVLNLPRLELRNVSQRTTVPYEIHHLVLSENEKRIDLPITEKVAPGTYDIRIKVVEGPWDPTWLDAGMLTLARFEVPKGFLVYFGTIDIDVTCREFGKRGEAAYAKHTIGEEYEFELGRFKKEYPDILKMYQGRIIRSVANNPWKRS